MFANHHQVAIMRLRLLDDALPGFAFDNAGVPLRQLQARLQRQRVELLPGLAAGLLAVVLDGQGVHAGELKPAFERHLERIEQQQPGLRRHASDQGDGLRRPGREVQRHQRAAFA